MFPFQRSKTSAILLALLLLPLASCANSALGDGFQRSLKADDPSKLNGSTVNPPATVASSGVQLPSNFPEAIPRYPGAVLQEVVPTTGDTSGGQSANTDVITRWTSGDKGDRVLAFYREQLSSGGWQLSNSDPSTGTIVARQGETNATITVEPVSASPGPTTASDQTRFAIRYNQTSNTPTNNSTSPSPSPVASPVATGNLAQLPSFSITTSAGISGNTDPTRNQIATGPTSFSDLDKTPKPLQSYVQDVANLGVLTPASSKTKGNQPKDSSRFEPNKTISRREFARWLVSTNNRLNVDRPAQQIRLAESSTQPAFKDVPRSDPDFAVIQGLAEAGIIPSPLSGDSTAVTFRPNAPLTRETLLLWKVPLDTRQALPTATIDAIKQTWGFQDAAKIEPRALRAVLADYQNGDLANIRRVLGYTTLFQPKKPVTRAEAAAALWYFGFQGEGQSAQDALKSATP